jgi:hypothetical protein
LLLKFGGSPRLETNIRHTFEFLAEKRLVHKNERVLNSRPVELVDSLAFSNDKPASFASPFEHPIPFRPVCFAEVENARAVVGSYHGLAAEIAAEHHRLARRVCEHGTQDSSTFQFAA